MTRTNSFTHIQQQQQRWMLATHRGTINATPLCDLTLTNVLSVVTGDASIPCQPPAVYRLTAREGYIASAVSDATSRGTAQCPWLIQGRRGQRINITLWDFAAERYSSAQRAATSSSAVIPQAASQTCHAYAVIRERTPARSVTVSDWLSWPDTYSFAITSFLGYFSTSHNAATLRTHTQKASDILSFLSSLTQPDDSTLSRQYDLSFRPSVRLSVFLPLSYCPFDEHGLPWIPITNTCVGFKKGNRKWNRETCTWLTGINLRSMQFPKFIKTNVAHLKSENVLWRHPSEKYWSIP